MNRILTATAVAALIATGASAQMVSDVQRNTIEQFAPGYNIDSLSHDQVQSLLAIANGGGESQGVKSQQIQTMLSEMGVMMDTTATDAASVTFEPAAPSDVELATIQRYLPNLNVETLTEAEVDSLIAIANSGSESPSTKAAAMESVLGIN